MYVCMHVWMCARVCAYVCVCAWTEKQGRSNFFDPTRDPCITTSPPQLSQLVVPTCSNLLFVRSSEKSSRFPEKFPSRKCRFPFPFPFPIILSFPPLPESGDTIILQRLATPLPFIPSNWINREPSALVAGEQRVHRAQLHLEGDWVGVRGPPRAHDRPMDRAMNSRGNRARRFIFKSVIRSEKIGPISEKKMSPSVILLLTPTRIIHPFPWPVIIRVRVPITNECSDQQESQFTFKPFRLHPSATTEIKTWSRAFALVSSREWNL